MNPQNRSLTTLATGNFLRKPMRTSGLIAVVALFSFVLFGSSILVMSLHGGMTRLQERTGADLMAVPLGYDGEMESVLIKGEPSYFYFDRSIESKIQKVEGVAQTSSQFFLTASNQECCDIPVQFIGFHPDTDFSVLPWIRTVYDSSGADRSLIVGSDVNVPEEHRLRFFGKEYQISAQLEETGTGLDQAVFARMEVMKTLYQAAQEKGFSFTGDMDPDHSISTVMIRIKKGYDANTVRHQIRVKLDGLQIITSKKIMGNFAETLHGFTVILAILTGMVLILAFVVLFVVFTVMNGERKREFGVLLIFGATRQQLRQIVLREAAMISGIGVLTGTGLAAAVFLPFSVSIGDALGVPYLTPSWPVLLLTVFLCAGIAFASGTMAAVRSAVIAGRTEPYQNVKGGK